MRAHGTGTTGPSVYRQVNETPPSPSGSPREFRTGARTIDVVVVGAASRDVAADDRRGWRLGGPVVFAALMLARLGLRVAALVGADATAAAAEEFALLRESGMDLHLVPMAHGPVFENVETPQGRVQRVNDPGEDLLPAAAGRLPDGGATARGWFLAPVAGELGEGWVDLIPETALVALGWQGLLRTFASDGRVFQRRPQRTRLVSRADLVSVSRDDLARDTPIAGLSSCLQPGATLVLTHGSRGGLIIETDQPGRPGPLRRYPAVISTRVVDPTGAGDSFLATLFAARVEPRLIGGRMDSGLDLALAAAAASLVVEGHGLHGVPSRSAVRDRLRDALADREPA